MVMQIIGALAGGPEAGGNVGCADVDALDPEPHDVLLGVGELGHIVIIDGHQLIQGHTRLVLGNDCKVGNTGDGKLTVGPSHQRLAAVNVLLDAFSSHIVEGGVIPSLKGEEGLHLVVFQHIQQGGQGLNTVHILVLLVNIPGKPLPAQLGALLGIDGHIWEDGVPDGIGESVLPVGAVQVGVESGEVRALRQHFRADICHQQCGNHALHPALVLVEEHFHAQHFLHQRLDHLDEAVLGLLVELEVGVVVGNFPLHVDMGLDRGGQGAEGAHTRSFT